MNHALIMPLDNNYEEINSEQITDTEEQVTNKEVSVPATPGSIFGGSRNIMKNSINQSPFHKYIFNTPC